MIMKAPVSHAVRRGHNTADRRGGRPGRHHSGTHATDLPHDPRSGLGIGPGRRSPWPPTVVVTPGPGGALRDRPGVGSRALGIMTPTWSASGVDVPLGVCTVADVPPGAVRPVSARAQRDAPPIPNRHETGRRTGLGVHGRAPDAVVARATHADGAGPGRRRRLAGEDDQLLRAAAALTEHLGRAAPDAASALRPVRVAHLTGQHIVEVRGSVLSPLPATTAAPTGVATSPRTPFTADSCHVACY